MVFAYILWIPSLFKKKKRFIYLKGQYERERGREIFYPPVYSVAGAAPGQNQGTRIFIQVPHVGAGNQGLKSSCTALPGTLPGSWIRSRAAGTQANSRDSRAKPAIHLARSRLLIIPNTVQMTCKLLLLCIVQGVMTREKSLHIFIIQLFLPKNF